MLFVYRLGLKRAVLPKLLLLLRYIFKTKILRKNCPGALILGVTYRCQCKCPYCSVSRYPVSIEEELNTEEIKTLINHIVKLGIPKINFFGGEPLLRNDLVQLVSYASKKGLFVFLDTNGYLLNNKMVSMLKKAGISTISVNFDSFLKTDGDIADKSLKTPLEKVELCLNYCINENIPCVISIYVDKNLIKSHTLKQIVDFCKKRGAAGVRLLLPMHCGGLLNDKNILSEDDLKIFYSLINNYFVYHESILYSRNKGKRICEARLKKTVYVSPYGEVQFCYTVPFAFGNIRTDSLEDVLHRMWQHNLFKMAPLHECAMNDSEFRETCNNFKLRKDNGFVKSLY